MTIAERVITPRVAQEVSLVGLRGKGLPPSPLTPEVGSTDILFDLNSKLESASDTTIKYEATGNQLFDYLKTLKLPLGSSIKSGDAHFVEEGQVTLSASIGIPLGGISFAVTLVNDNDVPQGVRVATSPTIDLSGAAKARKGFIEDRVTHLNQLLIDQINARINSNWNVKSLYIGRGALGLNLEKRKAVSLDNSGNLLSDDAYSREALELFERDQNKSASTYINELVQGEILVEQRERVTLMAHEIYQKTRDVVGPAYIALSDVLLKKLSKGESDLILCLARDGLPFAMVQKILLSREQDRYSGARSDQIQYLHISRSFLARYFSDPDFAERYRGYMQRLTVLKAKRIILSDLISGSGETHEGMEQILGDREIEGFYLDAHSPSSTTHSFLKESLDDPRASLPIGTMLLLFESLLSGPYESAEEIIEKSTGKAPLLKRKQLHNTGDLSEESILILNQIAIKGILDSIERVHRRRVLGIPDAEDAEIMHKFWVFIKSQPSGLWVNICASVPWQDFYGKWHLSSEDSIEE